jgi:hypothetical protein
MKITLIFAIALLCSCKQGSKSTPETVEKETINSIRNYVYADATGKRVMIYNSLSKGEGYIAPNGKQYFKVIFWTRIINETDNPLEFKIDFPADFYEDSEFPGNHYKLFIANDTMTIDKEPLNNYGFTGVKSFLDNNIEKPTSLKRTIHPKASTGFYVISLSHSTNITGSAALRTGFNLKGQDLIYKISRYAGKPALSLISEKEINCGSINLKNLVRQK